MVQYKFIEQEREKFVELQTIVKSFYIESEYLPGLECFGCAEGDLSRETWTYQFIDDSGKEVFFYSFEGVAGKYKGELRISLPDEEQKKIISKIEKIVSELEHL